MSVTLALLLAVPLCNATAAVAPITFEDMVDSAQLVVIAKVDSMWESIDPVVRPDGTEFAAHHTHVLAELLTAYVKDTSLVPCSNSIHIVYAGGLGLHINPSVSFEEKEVFLAAITPHSRDQSKDETIYRVVWRRWKYTIKNDSLEIHYADPLPIEQVIGTLSSSFTQVQP
jgi:hypothetical protein